MIHSIGARIRPYARAAVQFFEPSSQSERAERAAHVFALLLVAVVAIVKSVSGVTPDRVPFTFFLAAVAGAAARGGFAPAIVATLASLLVAGIGEKTPATTEARVLFGIEGVAIAAVVSTVLSRLRAAEARLDTAEASIEDLQRNDRRGRAISAALRHLECVADEAAVVVLNDSGMITEWSGSAERLYGYSADHAVGVDAGALLFDRQSQTPFADLLQRAAESGSVRQPDVHRRRDGTRVHVDVELRRFHELDAYGFTLAVHNVARRREWEAYREAAVRAQTALQQAADDARSQLAALETLIDPMVNPLADEHGVAELLERLRTILNADGAALVPAARVGGRVIAAGGVQPIAGPRPIRPDAPAMVPGRVTLIHNDPRRVEQASAVRWPDEVSSLMLVPVVYDGQAWSTIELVNERPRRASDWDVALMRVTADRLGPAVLHERTLATKVS